MKISQYPLDHDQYVRSVTKKTQIYLHHTAGNANPYGTYNWWGSTPERIGTCIIIGGKPVRSRDKWYDGEIVQGFSSKYWAYHLGLKSTIFKEYELPYIKLDKSSIGVELCNWGPLTKEDGNFLTYIDTKISDSEVCELEKPFKGYQYYHAYTDAQINSLYELLIYWKDRYNLPLSYSNDLWNVSKKALSGKPGLYTHNSVRPDKFDLSPQPKLIKMLKSI